MLEDPEESDPEGEDYYSFLNIPKNATEDDISNAYRRLSRMYHPDKHTDPERKVEAETLFNKTKTAYEVLGNPHKRAIYDNLGSRGLKTEGWEIVERTKTPQEIREEYERLAKERDERRLMMSTNPKSTVTMHVNATELFNSYDDEIISFDLRDLVGLPHIEISGMNIDQTIDAPLTTKDTCVFEGHISSQNGNGAGNMVVGVRRVISEKGWGEFGIGAGNGMLLSLKGFRNFTSRIFGNAMFTSNLSPTGVQVGATATIANQLDKHTCGYLTWKMGNTNGMTTTIVRETLKHSVIATMFFGIPHTYISLTYSYKLEDKISRFKMHGKVGTFGALLEYGAEKKVSRHSSLAAHMSVGVPTGVTLKVKFRRASQTYAISFLLCEDLLPAPILYGTIVPIVSWMALQKLVIQPYIKQKKSMEVQKQREANKAKLLKRKQEAKSAIDLMRETVKRIVEQEESRHGLIVLQSLYGRLIAEGSDFTPADDDYENQGIIEVTLPLQCLVKDSKLILQDNTKSQLPGFYDPCPGEDKLLRVRYLFRAVVHQVTLKDEESLRIPKQSHRIDA